MTEPAGQPSVVALVPAAGRGERLGAHVPKALVRVRGEPMVRRAVGGLLGSGVVDSVVVAANPSLLDEFADCLADFGARCSVITGGADRPDSVRNALAAVPEAGADFVLVHDAARAFTPAEVIRGVVTALTDGASAVVPCLPAADTVKEVDAQGTVTGTPDRARLRLVQTPQGFAEPLLRAVYATNNPEVTDDSRLVELHGERVHTVPGHPYAMKITTQFDLRVAETILAAET